MHKDLLSDKERKMLKQFLESGEKQEGFRMLKMRLKRNYPCISQDYELLKQVMNKLESSKLLNFFKKTEIAAKNGNDY